MSDSIEYKCVTTSRDYLQANRIYGLRDAVFWLIWTGITLVCAHGGYSALASLIAGGDIIKHLVSLTIFVGLYVGWHWMIFRYPERSYRKLPYVDVEYDMTVNEEGVFGSGSHFSYGLFWKIFTKAMEGPDIFVLVVGKRGFHPLPKRCIAETDVERVREMIRAHIPESRLLN